MGYISPSFSLLCTTLTFLSKSLASLQTNIFNFPQGACPQPPKGAPTFVNSTHGHLQIAHPGSIPAASLCGKWLSWMLFPSSLPQYPHIPLPSIPFPPNLHPMNIMNMNINQSMAQTWTQRSTLMPGLLLLWETGIQELFMDASRLFHPIIHNLRDLLN